MFVFVDVLAGAYVLAFVLAQLFPAIAQPPLGYVTSFFLVRDPLTLGLYLFTFIFFLRNFEKFEKSIGTQKFVFAYFLAGVVGNLNLFNIGVVEAQSLGAEGAVMGLLGMIVALHPYEIVFERFIPVPAIVSAAFLIVVNFMFQGSLEVIPLLVGMMLGYLWKERIEHPKPKQEPQYGYRR